MKAPALAPPLAPAPAPFIIAWPKSFVASIARQLCQWLPCGINEPRTFICLTNAVEHVPLDGDFHTGQPAPPTPPPRRSIQPRQLIQRHPQTHGTEAAPNALHCKIGFCKLFGHNIYFHLNAIWLDSAADQPQFQFQTESHPSPCSILNEHAAATATFPPDLPTQSLPVSLEVFGFRYEVFAALKRIV